MDSVVTSGKALSRGLAARTCLESIISRLESPALSSPQDLLACDPQQFFGFQPLQSPQDFVWRLKRLSHCGRAQHHYIWDELRVTKTRVGLWGGRDSNPHASYLSADFESSQVFFKPYRNR